MPDQNLLNSHNVSGRDSLPFRGQKLVELIVFELREISRESQIRKEIGRTAAQRSNDGDPRELAINEYNGFAGPGSASEPRTIEKKINKQW